MKDDRKSGMLSYDNRYKGVMGLYFKKIEEDGIAGLLPYPIATILDLGGGTGRLVQLLGERAKTGIIMDIDISCLEIAMKKTGDQGNIYTVCGDAMRIPLKDSSVTGVIALGTMGYMNNIYPMLDELGRICKEDSFLIFTCWNKDRWSRYFSNSISEKSVAYSLDEIEAALSHTGFRITSFCSLFFMPRNIFWGLYSFCPGKILKDIWILISLGFELIAMRMNFLRRKGYELFITAHK